MPDLRTHCVLCCDSISDQPLNSKTQVKILTNWNQGCVSSFCQTFQLNPSYLQKTGFCLKCHNLLRDMDFVVRSIGRFQKRLKTLKTRVKAILTINAKELGEGTHAYAKKVKKIFQDINDPVSGPQKPTACNSESSLSETYEFETNFGSSHEDSSLVSTADMEIDNDSICRVEINERPKRIRKSMIHTEESKYDVEEIDIKYELDDEAEIYDGYDDNHDPDFNIDDECPTNPTMDSVPIKSGNTVNYKPGKKKTKFKKSLPGKLLRCSYPNCSVFCRKQELMAAHVRQVHEVDPTPYQCPECELKFKSGGILKRHRRDAHGLQLQKYPCPHCERIYDSKQRVNIHISELHNVDSSVKHRCSTCTKIFNNYEQLQEHIELHNAIRTTDQPFACVICKFHCIGILELKAHVFKVHEESALKCPNEGCDKVFLTKSRLEYHIRFRHKLNDRNDLVCPECSFLATRPSALKTHMVKHSSAKPIFTCDRDGCGKIFSYKNTLNRHKKFDHDKDPAALFKCTLCPKTFKQSNGLTTHQAHHSNIRTFFCEHCSAGFKTLKTLKSHYKVHEGSTHGGQLRLRSMPRKGRLPPVLDTYSELSLPLEARPEPGLETHEQGQVPGINFLYE